LTPLVIAHRGASWDLPGNTLPAFRRAIELEADYVEFDVRAAPDGTLVVAHDRVRDDRATDLPTLDAVLEACVGRVGLALELKERRVVEPSLRALAGHGADPDSVLVVSFLPRAILDTRRLRRDLRTVQHLAYVPMRTAARYAWGIGLADAKATDRALALARRLDVAATVYTVNDERRMRELVDASVGAIFTDRPDLLRRVLSQA
jgi:glycerophosphoryl diester phosphodiesterase